MKIPTLAPSQSKFLLAIAVMIFSTSSLLVRLLNARSSTWISMIAATIFVTVATRGYNSRLTAFVHSGLAILGSSWCAYGIWRVLARYKPIHESGIDSFAGPLAILALSTCIAGLSIYMAGLWMVTRKGMPFVQRFSKQRGLWILGAVTIPTQHKSGSPPQTAALLLLLALTPAFAKPQEHLVTIKVINARTNKPVTDEKLNVALRVDQIGSVAMPTDKEGVIEVKTGDATTIRILSNMYADCRSRGELYTDYSITEIRNNGITTGNLCSDAKPKAKPGDLILFEIPRTDIPKYPKPPVSYLPHSDEKPH
jgi:hypothetical protein